MTSPPRILPTVAGSYPVPEWLAARPARQALLDARVTRERAGNGLVTDAELYRLDPEHPATNGMIDRFLRPLAACAPSSP